MLQASQASLRAANNDSVLAVAEAYFYLQQARGELAGAMEALRQATKLARITADLAPGLAPELEVTRVRAELGRRAQLVQAAWEHWRVASIELSRILRLDSAALIQPMEPPQIKVTLVPPETPLDDLMPIALSSRPELASQKALVEAALQRWKQEKFRPLLPNVVMAGASTSPSGSLGAGVYGSGVNDSLGQFGARLDYDVQLLWQLDNLGFGNAAKMDARRSQHQIANLEFLQTQDNIVAEVSQAQAQVRFAVTRGKAAEDELRDAVKSVEKNFEGLKETNRVGNVLLLVVRPQEALASIQALGQAYNDYFQTIADFNRAQFRLYRALGNPANYPCLPGAPVLGPLNSSQPRQ